MNKRLLVIILLLFFLSGCKPVRVKNDFVKLQQKTQEQTGHSIHWHDIGKKKEPKAPKTKQVIEIPSPVPKTHCFSQQQAIAHALEHNSDLQAAFEDLGIAKSDLVQAGLFTNPLIKMLNKYPIFNLDPVERRIVNRHTKIDFFAMMELADFWQVPIKKKIAYDDLEVMIFTILHLVIEISVRTKLAYDTCLYMETRLCLLEEIYEQLHSLQDRIYYRQGFGFERDLDRYLIDIRVAKWQTMIIQQKAELRVAYANLRLVMGLAINTESLHLSDTLAYDTKQIPSVNCLEQFGLEYRPALQIKQLKIAKSEHNLSLQKRKVLNHFQFGIAYERDLIQGQGVGPGVRLQLPIFDPNYAQIARARFEHKKAKKSFKVEKRHMIDQIYQGHEELAALQEELEIYKNSIVHSSQHAIDYSNKFFNRMQLNMTVLLESQITWFEVREAMLIKNYEMAKMYAHLEQAVGKLIS